MGPLLCFCSKDKVIELASVLLSEPITVFRHTIKTLVDKVKVVKLIFFIFFTFSDDSTTEELGPYQIKFPNRQFEKAFANQESEEYKNFTDRVEKLVWTFFLNY